MCYVGLLSTFCEVHGPTLIMATIITSSQTIEALLPKIAQELADDPFKDCDYCKTFDSKSYPCLASFEDGVTYVSSRCGAGIIDTKCLKHASMRCLSCESGTSKFVISDNLLLGGLVCLNFRVPDEKARGLSRLYSLAVTAVGSSKTSILSSNITRLIFPKLESIVENVTNQSSLTLVNVEKHKAMTYVHLSMVQLLSLLCHESEESVKFSPLKKPATSAQQLDLSYVKAWATNEAFKLLLDDIIRQNPITIQAKTELRPHLLNFLRTVTLPKLNIDGVSFVDQLENPDYQLGDGTVMISSPRSTASTSYVLELIQALTMDILSDNAIQAKIDLIAHKYSTLLRHWPSKVTPAFLKSKKLTDVDVEWCLEYLAGHR